MSTIEVKVPDIGDFKDVEIIEVHVKAGDRLAAEDPMITLESDKASMEVPAPAAGTVKELKVKAGDRVSEGDLILVLDTEAAAERKEEPKQPEKKEERPKQAAAPARAKAGDGDLQAEVLVLGSGPGGYTAAFRAADLGKKVVLVERYPTLGGVCLNVGCIPSKALLHAAKVIAEAREMAEHGLSFGKPEIDLDKLADWKDGVVGRLTGGLAGLAKQRKVQVVQGVGAFTSANQLAVETGNGRTTSASSRRSSPPARRRSSCRSSRRTTRASWTRPARSSSTTSRSACWCWAAASSASRWPPSTTSSARRSPWSS